MELIQVIMARFHNEPVYFKLEYINHWTSLQQDVIIIDIHKGMPFSDKTGTCFTIRITIVSHHIYLITRDHTGIEHYQNRHMLGV